MMIQVTVPDVGEATEVEVIEVLVAVGDVVGKDDSLVVLESDKASMEIPSPYAGKIVNIAVKVGDKVEEGSLILELDLDGEAVKPADKLGSVVDKSVPSASSAEVATLVTDELAPTAVQPPAADSTGTMERLIVVPDIGDANEVTVTELLVKLGDKIAVDDPILVLESDKASMEIPAPYAGEVSEILVKEGALVTEGDPLIKVQSAQGAPGQVDQDSTPKAAQQPSNQASQKSQDGNQQSAEKSLREKADLAHPMPERQMEQVAVVKSTDTGIDRSDQSPRELEGAEATNAADDRIHAGPAVRKQAREYGVSLAKVRGTGQNGRILKEDVQVYVKTQLQLDDSARLVADTLSGGIPPIPIIDFSQFGDIELRPLSRVRRSSARNLHRSWLNVAHVTQFDEADITDLEAFRKTQNLELASSGDKLTPLAFLIKACVQALIKYPQFNSSIDADYQHLTLKKYYNIGIAVETPDGLMVPVLREANKKGVVELARESALLAAQARDKKLPLNAMQGATFTITSLGGIGGTAFTPIVNAPEVAILGVSRASMGPVWDGQGFVPRMLLPLSLSYDHRAIDGAEAARFTHYLTQLLGDVRRLIL